VRELVICFVMMGYIHSAVVQPTIIQPAVIRTIIQLAVALHIVEGFDVEK